MHGTNKKNLLVPVEDLLAISSILLFDYVFCREIFALSGCMFQNSHHQKNLANIITGSKLVPVDTEAIFSGYDNYLVFAIVLFCRENISLRNVVFATLLSF